MFRGGFQSARAAPSFSHRRPNRPARERLPLRPQFGSVALVATLIHLLKFDQKSIREDLNCFRQLNPIAVLVVIDRQIKAQRRTVFITVSRFVSLQYLRSQAVTAKDFKNKILAPRSGAGNYVLNKNIALRPCGYADRARKAGP